MLFLSVNIVNHESSNSQALVDTSHSETPVDHHLIGSQILKTKLIGSQMLKPKLWSPTGNLAYVY